MPSATIREVAQEAGVSVSSVSRILGGASHYRYQASTQQRVREAALRLGYQAHAAARLLRQQERNLIGLAVSVSEQPVRNQLLIAAHRELIGQGYKPVLVEPDQLVPTHSHAPFPSPEMLAGILSLDSSMELKVPDFYHILRQKLPVVAVYPVASGDVEAVFTDRAKGIEMAVEYLVSLGHHRIAFSAMQSHYPTDTQKVEGWNRALKKYNINAHPKYSIPIHYAETIEQMATRLVQALVQLKPPPTALVCTSDATAMSVMGQLSARGWSIPQDLSIVGFDGIEYGAFCHPPLTTIVQPVERIAQVAVGRLMQLIQDSSGGDGAKEDEGTNAREQPIEPTLLVRGSTTVPAM